MLHYNLHIVYLLIKVSSFLIFWCVFDLQVHHDMNFPLAHYFLYTGHNSYLTGNQVSSASSTSAIIKALKKGVRVIELDLWPNSRGDDVLVHHGGYGFIVFNSILGEEIDT